VRAFRPGCTGHAHEVAAYLGDEIAARARTLVHDAASPAEVVPFAINGGSGSLSQLTAVSDGLGTGQSPREIAAVDFD